MPGWTFYPVFIGTIVSIVSLTRIAIQHRTNAPITLSELVAAEEALLRRFRNILLFCGVLFAITLFGFIVPRTNYLVPVILFGVLMIGGNLIAAVIPARAATAFAHLLFAQGMAIGMWGLGLTFAIALPGLFSALAFILAFSMTVFALLTLLDKKHYLRYELAFIFSSHLSILVAAIALQ